MCIIGCANVGDPYMKQWSLHKFVEEEQMSWIGMPISLGINTTSDSAPPINAILTYTENSATGASANKTTTMVLAKFMAATIVVTPEAWGDTSQTAAMALTL